MFKILRSLSMITAVAAIAGIGTYSFVTSTDTSQDYVLKTPTFGIQIDETVQSPFPVITETWLPGEEVTARFDVKNNGSVPVHLGGFATGDWDNSSLNADKVLVTKFEYHDGTAWQIIKQNSNGLNGVVYYGQNGNDSNLYVLPANSTKKFKITLKLDTSADNTYIHQTFRGNIHLGAKQTTPGAVWPTF